MNDRIKGIRCPSCDHETLFLSDSGRITCSLIGCKDPSAFYSPKPPAPPVPMLLWCPECGVRHIDVGDFATKLHHTHACQGCGHVWRPAVVHTVGVQFLPGFKNGEPT